MVRAGLAIVMAAALSLPACAGNKPTLGDGDLLDGRRDGALAVFINRKVTDKISVPDGDDVDWKYCDIPRPGRIQVGVSFDTADRIEGEVVFRDSFGSILERQRIEGGRSFYEFRSVQAVRGRYYIEISGRSGASVYTVGVLFEEPELGTFFSRPVSKGPAILVDVPETGRGAGGRAGSTSPPTEEVPLVSPSPEPPVEAEEARSAISVRGTIRRITPLEGGGSLLTILVSGADGELVRAGARGTINGLGSVVTVRRRAGQYVKAFTKTDAEALQSYKGVTFRVRIKE
jgi:hypothetical protein